MSVPRKPNDEMMYFNPKEISTWPLQKLRVLIWQKPTKACPNGFFLYGVRQHDGTYWSYLYQKHIPIASIRAWCYAPVAQAKRFTPKIYYKANEDAA